MLRIIDEKAAAFGGKSLEQRGVILGYRADVDPQALGLAIRAQIRLALDGTATPQKEKDVLRLLTAHPMVRAVSRVSGEDCFVATMVARRIEDVTALLSDVQATRTLQSSRTAFVLESVVDKPGLGPIDAALMAVTVPVGAVSGARVRSVARRSREKRD